MLVCFATSRDLTYQLPFSFFDWSLLVPVHLSVPLQLDVARLPRNFWVQLLTINIIPTLLPPVRRISPPRRTSIVMFAFSRSSSSTLPRWYFPFFVQAFRGTTLAIISIELLASSGAPLSSISSRECRCSVDPCHDLVDLLGHVSVSPCESHSSCCAIVVSRSPNDRLCSSAARTSRDASLNVPFAFPLLPCQPFTKISMLSHLLTTLSLHAMLRGIDCQFPVPSILDIPLPCVLIWALVTCSLLTVGSRASTCPSSPCTPHVAFLPGMRSPPTRGMGMHEIPESSTHL